MRPIDHLRNEMRGEHPVDVIATAVDGLAADVENDRASFPPGGTVAPRASGASFTHTTSGADDRTPNTTAPLALFDERTAR